MTQLYPEIRVSAIIATRDRHQEIKRSLRALLGGSRRPDEIVIYDQSANDLTRDEVLIVQAEPHGDIINYNKSEKRGISANRNDALRAATGDFIVSVDDDIEVEAEWLENMMREWIAGWQGKPVLITGPILPAPEFEADALITAVRTSKERFVIDGQPQYSNVLIGAQFGASKELIAALGSPPFDERLGAGCRYPGADDEEFAYRVQKAGFPVVYEPTIRVTHYTERVSDWRRVNYKYGVGNGAAMAKHFSKGDARVFFELVRAFATNLVKAMKYAIRLKEPEGSARLFTAVGLGTGMFKWIFASVTGRNGSADIYSDERNG